MTDHIPAVTTETGTPAEKPGAANMPSTTTFQEDLITAGQRRINLIWEWTQAAIALIVVLANMIVGVSNGMVSTDKRPEYPVILSSALFLVVGFYFSRTNHAAIGGVGPKPNPVYTGR
jgi:hypothetical protein